MQFKFPKTHINSVGLREMFTYTIKRLLQSLVVVWAAVTLMFALFFIIPGDPISLKSGEKALPQEILDNIQRKYGLDKPVYAQYLRFWGNLLHGDLGYSYKNDKSVNTILHDGLSTSARLLFWGALFQLIIAFTVGLTSAIKRGSLGDRIGTVFSVGIQGIPVFVSGLLAQYLFGVLPFQLHWDWLNFFKPWPQSWHLGVIPGDSWKGIILPALVVAVVDAAFIARMLRSSLLEVLRADYIRTAFAKGLSARRVWFHHALRNALIPVVTVYGTSLIAIFGVAVQTEKIFSLPGMGSTIADSALSQDAPVVLGLAIVVIAFGAVVNLIVDLSYALIDPRIKIDAKAVH
jgi:ABC-type dipeptide/oligopeptide/nickel transport system permease component